MQLLPAVSSPAPASSLHGEPWRRVKRRSWTGVTADVVETRGPGAFDEYFESADHQLVAMLLEVGGRVEMRRLGGADPGGPRHARQPLSLIPSHLPVRGYAAGTRIIRHLTLRLDLPALAAMHGGSLRLPDRLRPRLMFADQGLFRIAELFGDACGDDGEDSPLYGDSLSMALLASLLKMEGATGPTDTRGGLAPWQLRAAIALLEENLDGELRMQALADRVRLSCSHFSRAFRHSTGLAPHQWLIQARIARAQALLVEGKLPLAEVALSLGFHDQAHFTRTFSKTTGSSPGTWRRAHGSVGSVAVGRP